MFDSDVHLNKKFAAVVYQLICLFPLYPAIAYLLVYVLQCRMCSTRSLIKVDIHSPLLHSLRKNKPHSIFLFQPKTSQHFANCTLGWFRLLFAKKKNISTLSTSLKEMNETLPLTPSVEGNEQDPILSVDEDEQVLTSSVAGNAQDPSLLHGLKMMKRGMLPHLYILFLCIILF